METLNSNIDCVFHLASYGMSGREMVSTEALVFCGQGLVIDRPCSARQFIAIYLYFLCHNTCFFAFQVLKDEIFKHNVVFYLKLNRKLIEDVNVHGTQNVIDGK